MLANTFGFQADCWRKQNLSFQRCKLARFSIERASFLKDNEGDPDGHSGRKFERKAKE
jgi:hypothetical protein